MNNNYNTPAQRLVRETVSMLNHDEISPEHAFAMIRFAADGSDDPMALAELARMYNDGIGCEKNRELAIDLLCKSGKFDFLMDPAPAHLDPWEDDYTMDNDEIYAKREEEDRLVDLFLDSEWKEEEASYARYDPSCTGCSADDPVVLTGDNIAVWERLELEAFFHWIPNRYVQYEVVEKKTLLKDGRHLDHFRVRVSTYPLLAQAANGKLFLPASKFIGYEDYWFDVEDRYRNCESLLDVIKENVLEAIKAYDECGKGVEG